jgi:hypothetical protein
MAGIIFGIGAFGMLIGHSLKTSDPKQQLKRKAQRYFDELETPEPMDLSKIDIREGDEPQVIARKVLNNHKGFVIAELHRHTASKYFLIQSLETMKKEGLAWLGLEISDEYQKDMDDYLSKKADIIPPALQKRLDNAFFKLDGRYYYNSQNIIEKSRELGIKILCLDSKLCTSDFSLKQEELDLERRSLMNYNAIKTIASHAEKGKFVILTGLGHACPFDKPKVPSLSTLLGVPSVFVKDTNEWIGPYRKECLLEEENPSFKISLGSPTTDGGHPDITLETDPVVKHDEDERSYV